MKSNLEKKLHALRESAEVLVGAELGEAALNVMCSFSELECVIDVQLEDGWIRYLLIEGGDDENADTLRRIG